MPQIKTTESKATRLGFGEELLQLGKENSDVVVLGADVTGSVKTDLFMKAFPDRFFSVGIAEQDLIGTAVGLAVSGKIAFASAYGEFLAGRPFDQIRQSVAYSRIPVKLFASHCGIAVGPDGATHQAMEDIAIMRVLPHMIVASPCDYHQAKKMTRASVGLKDPCYVRFFRDNTPVFTDPSAAFTFGRADTLIQGTDVTVIACGMQVWESILAEEILAAEGISVRVINMHTIKPLDREAVLRAARETGAIVTAEDHQRTGGLGSAVAEFLAGTKPTPQEFVAINDHFGESGKGTELMVKYGIAKDGIVEAVRKVLRRKKEGNL